jgi:hypothetical protein
MPPSGNWRLKLNENALAQELQLTQIELANQEPAYQKYFHWLNSTQFCRKINLST